MFRAIVFFLCLLPFNALGQASFTHTEDLSINPRHSNHSIYASKPLFLGIGGELSASQRKTDEMVRSAMGISLLANIFSFDKVSVQARVGRETTIYPLFERVDTVLGVEISIQQTLDRSLVFGLLSKQDRAKMMDHRMSVYSGVRFHFY